MPSLRSIWVQPLRWPTALVFALATLVVIGGNADAAVAYIRSEVGAPWSSTSNEQAMDLVFGAGGWDDLRYETIDPATLYSPAYTFIYMEGSDNNASELEVFLLANQVALENWVTAGGNLFLNAAPNEGSNQDWGFGGVFLNYTDFPADPGTAVNPTHPIWNGPFLPTSPAGFSGGSYAHATVTGPGLIPHIIDSDGGNPNLAELAFGTGRVMFGGLTTSNFWTPESESLNLRANIIAYLNSICFNGNIAIPDGPNPGIQNILTGTASIIQDLNVSVRINHTWVGDLIVSLTHTPSGGPAGTPVVLIDRPGVPASGAGCSQNNIDAMLDDEAINPAEATCVNSPPDPALGGSLIPNNLLSVFDGQDFSGQWALDVSDNAAADTGNLIQWCLIATFSPISPDAIFQDGFE